MAQFRKGDVVKIRSTVSFDQTTSDTVYVNVGYRVVGVQVEDVELAVPKLNEGERVRAGGDYVTVIAIYGDNAWVRYDDGPQMIIAAADVDRLDGTPQINEAEA